MELRQLEHFVAVVEEGSFTRAANRCHIVQSGLSASIRTLEDELGAKLFVRSSRTFAITREGEALLEEAYRALRAARAGAEAVAAVQGLERGTLFVAAAKILPPPFDPAELLHEFHRAHPAIRLRLRQDSSTQLLRALRDGTVDLGIIGAVRRMPSGVTAHPLARSPMVLACAPSHRFASAASVSLPDLAGESLVDMSKEWSSRQISQAAFQRTGVEQQVNFEVNDPACLLALVERNLGVAIVPDMLKRLKSKAVFVPISPALPEWELVAAHLGNAPPNIAAARFLEIVIAEAKRFGVANADAGAAFAHVSG